MIDLDAIFWNMAQDAEHFRNIQRHTHTLAALEKTSSYADHERSTRYCMQMLEESGFEQIERIAHTADGKSACCDLVMPEAWNLLGRSFLEITSEGVSEFDRVLADTDIHPAAANIWSAPTPAGGVDAEIVDYEAIENDISQAAGKIVFFCRDRGFNGAYRKLAAAGAAAVAITKFTAELTEPDAMYWFNGMGCFGWYLGKDDIKLPIFSLAPYKARLLQKLLQQGKVTAHAEMNTRLYDGHIYTVTGVIPGESSEEYALLAHVYEPFAGDDALGAALGAEVGRVLRDSGVKPRKTLRLVLSMELFGFVRFMAENKQYAKTLAAMSLDGFTHRCSPEISFRQSPLASPFFGDFFGYQNGVRRLPDAPWSQKLGTLSDDTFGGDCCMSVPTNWFYNPSGVHHHNTGTGFLPDWELTQKRFPMLADTVLQLICRSTFPDYTECAALELQENIKAVLSNDKLPVREKAAHLNIWKDFQIGRLRSMEKFTGVSINSASLEKLCEDALAELPAPEELSALDKVLAQTVVIRHDLLAPSSLARIPQAERKPLRMASRGFFAYADGKRSVLEMLYMTGVTNNKSYSQEEHQILLDELKYLEQYGYLTLKTEE